MRKNGILVALFPFMASVSTMALYAGEVLCEDSDFPFFLDTTGSPYLVDTLSRAQKLSYIAGETISIFAPDGTLYTPISSASENGAYDWIPAVGGTWSLTNDFEGTAAFVVRHSLFPDAVGSGTIEDPVRVVDAGDFDAFVAKGVAKDGICFRIDGLFGFSGFNQPDGMAFHVIEDGCFQLKESADGLLFLGAEASFPIDTRGTGPDRRMRRNETMLLAYSGNEWIGDEAASSSLSIVYETDTRADMEFTGNGTVLFEPRTTGVYTVTLTAGENVSTSRISVSLAGTFVILR